MNLEGIIICATLILCVVSRTLAQSRGDQTTDLKYIEEAVQIVNTIFHKYKPDVPPRKNYPDPVMLKVNLQVQYVTALDVVAQTLDSTVDLEVTWKDSRLSWYPLVVKEITVAREKIWTPVLSIDNAVQAPMDIHRPEFVIKSNGEIYSYRRLQLRTFCETNLTSTVEDCEIVLGSNLLNDRIVDFDMNSSSCGVSTSTHALQVSPGSDEKRSEDRAMLKENATFPEFVCTIHIQDTGCCTGSSGSYRDNNGVDSIMLSYSLFICVIVVLCLL